jgi:NTE family protein
MRTLGLPAVVLLSLLAGCAHQPPASKPRQTCLVLSAGGAKGVAHLGAIAAVKKAGIRIDCVVGNSIGALIGSLYATAPELDTRARFEEFALSYRAESRRVARDNGVTLGLLLGMVAVVATGGVAAPAVAAGGGYLLGSQLTAEVDRDRMVTVMDRFYGGAAIETLPVAYATFYQRRSGNGLELVDVRTGNLAQAVGKSLANPFIFRNLDVVGQGAVDPAADRAAMTPVDDACRLFPDHALLAINLTGQPAFYRGGMRCPVQEVMVEVPELPVEAAFQFDEDFERTVAVGYQATARAVAATAPPGRRLVTLDRTTRCWSARE